MHLSHTDELYCEHVLYFCYNVFWKQALSFLFVLSFGLYITLLTHTSFSVTVFPNPHNPVLIFSAPFLIFFLPTSLSFIGSMFSY